MHRLKGWLIVNAFLHSDKFNELTEWFLISAGIRKITLTVYTNAELLVGVELTERPDFVLFWDKDVQLAQYLESYGIKVYNSSKSIAACDDKRLTFLTLRDSGIAMPKTILAPFTYQNIGYNKLNFIEQLEQELVFPMVLKEAFGSFGEQVYLINNSEELYEKIKLLSPKPLLFQEFMGEYAGNDVRLQVVGKNVVAAMFRYSTNGDFRANITLGGKMQSYVPTNQQCQMAIKAVELLGLSFGGVDLLFGHDEEPVLCEVNSNAHFKSIFQCTGINVADKILDFIIDDQEIKA
jgi:RimK family alpha-L-glutamate ligase